MRKKARQIVLILGDVFLAFLSLLITVRLGFWDSFSWNIFFKHLLPFSFLYLFWLIVFYIFNLYDLSGIKPKLQFLGRLSWALIVCLIFGVIFFYTLPFFDITPKTNLLINVVVFGSLFLGWRRLFFSLFSTFYLRRVAFLGRNKIAEQLIQRFKESPQLGYYFVKFLDPKKSLSSQVKDLAIESIIISREVSSDPKIIEELYNLLPLKINFLSLTDVFEDITQKIPVEYVDYGWFLRNLTEGEKRVYDRLKRAVDIVFALFILFFSFWLWPLIALAIKIDDGGSVFYKQKRVGKNKTTFWIWKFRTMREDAEKSGPQWAAKDDQRATRVGRFLRKSHLDELPQMINILRGDISLVGPRPERPEFVKKLEKQIPHYHLRHIIKPGFTGWAQVKFRYGRSVNDAQKKLEYDLYYLKNRNLLFDIGILLKTFRVLF